MATQAQILAMLNAATAAGMSNSDIAAMLAPLSAAGPAASVASTATAAPAAPAATAPQPSAPTLGSLVVAYEQLGGTAYNAFPNLGNPNGLPSWQPADPAYVFAMAGPQALTEIFTGPGLQPAVFNAALYLNGHGIPPISIISPAVVTAVQAYVAANPSMVPTGTITGNIIGPQYPASTTVGVTGTGSNVTVPIVQPGAFAAPGGPLAGMTLVDLFYISYAEANVGQGIWSALFPTATQLEINAAINEVGSTNAAAFGQWYTTGGVSSYAGVVKAAVDAYVAAHPKK